MMLTFASELTPQVEITINKQMLFKGFAENKLNIDCAHQKGKLKVTMFDKDPNNQPAGLDKHIRLTSITFNDLFIDENEIYRLYDPQVKGEKTLYLGFNNPNSLELTIEHPYNKLIKRLALLSER